jgi:hypothetical protein
MQKKLVVLAALPLFLAGCEQAKPPTPEGLKKIAARTAKGTVFTKLEARSQPEKPRASEVSIWDLKVFKMQDKPDGTREEWKFFLPLSQPGGNTSSTNSTDVMMNAWLVSRDGTVFLPSRPSYKAYGSFVTDWNPPRPGAYTLYVEYQPSERGKTYPIELAQWNFSVVPGDTTQKPLSSQPHWTPNENPAPITLRGASDGEPAGTLSLEGLPTKAKEDGIVTLKGAPDGITDIEIAAVSAGGQFLHFKPQPDGKSFAVNFPKSGMYRIWAYFSLNGAPYAAPVNRYISS